MIRILLIALLSLSSLSAGYEFGGTKDKIPTKSVAKLPFDLKNSSVSVDPKIDEVSSKNGLTAWLVERNDLDVVSFAVMIGDAGTKADPKNRQGLVRLFLSLSDEGAGPYSAEAFKRHLLEHNIIFSADLNKDSFVLSFQCPKTSVDEAFEVLRLVLTEVRLDDRDIKKIKNQLLTSYQQSTQSEDVAGKELMEEKLYGEHPYTQKVQTFIDHLPTITKDDIRDYMKKYITQDKLIIAACGNISKEHLSQKLESTFSALPKTSSATTCEDIALKNPEDISRKTMDIPQSLILFAHPGIKRNDDHFYHVDLAMQIFGSGDFGSRLMRSIREEKGLVYGIGVNLSINKHSQLILGSASTRHKTAPEVIDLIKEEWKKLIEKGVTEEELKLAKMRLLGVFPLHFTNTTSITSILIAMQYNKLGIDFLKKRTQLIQDVKLEELNGVIKQVFSNEKLKFFLTGQDPKKEDSEDGKKTSDKKDAA